MGFPCSCSIWVALLGLTILPLVAHTSGRELLIGVYDLNNRRTGFQVGLLLILVATSIVDTAYIAQKYGGSQGIRTGEKG
jgi:hypothetical protein